MEAFQIRARAARELVDCGAVDGLEALVMILWPSAAVEAASVEIAARSEEELAERCDRAVELVERCWSQAAAAGEVGVSKATVGVELRRRRRNVTA